MSCTQGGGQAQRGGIARALQAGIQDQLSAKPRFGEMADQPVRRFRSVQTERHIGAVDGTIQPVVAAPVRGLCA